MLVASESVEAKLLVFSELRIDTKIFLSFQHFVIDQKNFSNFSSQLCCATDKPREVEKLKEH